MESKRCKSLKLVATGFVEADGLQPRATQGPLQKKEPIGVAKKGQKGK